MQCYFILLQVRQMFRCSFFDLDCTLKQKQKQKSIRDLSYSILQQKMMNLQKTCRSKELIYRYDLLIVL